jgi:hypothetical protein
MIDRQIAALLEQFGLPYSKESERLTFHMAQTLYHKIVEFGASNGVPPANIGGMIAYIAERDQAFFYVASERMIEIGAVQRLSQDGYRQAIKNLAYQIAMFAIEQVEEHGAVGTTNILASVRNTKEINKRLDQLDEIFAVISYGAGVHPSVVDKDVGEQLDEYLLAYVTSKQ